MRLHPISISDVAEAQLNQHFPDSANQVEIYDWIEEKLQRFPRGNMRVKMTRMPNPIHTIRDNGVSVVYEVPDTDPGDPDDDKDDAPGALVNVLAVLPSRGKELAEIMKQMNE